MNFLRAGSCFSDIAFYTFPSPYAPFSVMGIEVIAVDDSDRKSILYQNNNDWSSQGFDDGTVNGTAVYGGTISYGYKGAKFTFPYNGK